MAAKKEGMDPNIVARILRNLPVELRIHFVFERGCSYCCGQIIMSVVPLEAPCGPAAFVNENGENVPCPVTVKVGLWDNVYLQTNHNYDVACHNGWKSTEYHAELTTCKVAGTREDENQYAEPIRYTWYDLLALMK